MSTSTTASAIALTRLGQVAIPAKEIDRAVAFYRDVLGLRLLFQAPPKLAFFDCGGVRLMLSEPEGGVAFQPGSILYYVVDDLPGTHELLLSRGVTFLHAPRMIAAMPDHDLWMAFLNDSEGNVVGLMSEVRR